MRIIISGSSGFVGLNLRKYLADFKFKDIITLDRNTLKNLDFNDLQEKDIIIHLAGKAHDLKKTTNSDDYYAVNYELTRNLYNTFLKSKAEKFIFISSVKASADKVDGILTEDFVPAPHTHYGKSKLMAEQYINSKMPDTNKLTYILRPCMIHGPGNKGNLNLLFQFVKRGIPYPLAEFHNQRSFLSIENLCFIIKELIERNGVNSGTYLVADDAPLSTNEVVSILSESLGKRAKMLFIPPSIVRFIAKISDKLYLPLTTERLDKLTENYIVSNKKIKQALNKELPLSVKEGLHKTATSFSKL